MSKQYKIEGTILEHRFLVDKDGEKTLLTEKMLLHVQYGESWRTAYFKKDHVVSDIGICQNGDKIRIINEGN